jgi:hypothetical protein
MRWNRGRLLTPLGLIPALVIQNGLPNTFTLALSCKRTSRTEIIHANYIAIARGRSYLGGR